MFNSQSIPRFKIDKKGFIPTGGLFTAIDHTAKMHTGKELSKIVTKETKLSYTNFDNFLVVVATDNEIEGEKIGKEIGKQFHRAYNDILSSWDGNTAIFEKFKGEIDELVKSHEKGLDEELGELLDTLSLSSKNENNYKN
ncbi:MAG: hypothetical protein ACUVXA_15810 [Candidatus Jordarchaeum sp.]|uniref:hypothetical protein n=1 Tax=Candidatus Jordarchaeum sp. TaxID=2823881 RepID=UPI004049257A